MGYPSNKHYHGWTGGSGIDVEKSTHVEIRRVEVINTGAKGIYFDGVTDGVIEDCRVENTNMIERSGAYSIYHSVDVRVINSTSRHSGCIGVEAVKLLRGTISTNTILEPRLSGITLWRSGQTLVSENVLNKTEASNYGIRVAGLEYNEIKLNVVIGFSEPISIRYL
jgi:parallel beta-helix repeat protein